MRAIKLAKVTVHINVGKSGDVLEKARKVIEQITGQKSCTKQAKRTVKDFGIREGEPIACLTTLRGESASSFLKRGLEAAGNALKASSFDDNGNFAFGIKEHIEIPGIRYDPAIGILGMNISILLERPGFAVARRGRRMSRVGKGHLVSRDEAMQYFKDNFGVTIQ